MGELINALILNIDFFILMFVRVTALIVSSPIFGRKNIPNKLKILFCLIVTYAIFTSVGQAGTVVYSGIFEFAMLVIKEMLFGLALGYVTTLFFSIVQTAGQTMDMQMGFGMVNVFDVQNNINIPATGNFFTIVMLITFFTVDGHLMLIKILASTFAFIPVGGVVLNPEIGLVALNVFTLAFLLAVKVAMPMIAAGLLGEVIMGIIVKAIPQMNIFVVGIPLKIMLGLLMLLIIIPVFVHFCDTIFDQMFLSIEKVFLGLAG